MWRVSSVLRHAGLTAPYRGGHAPLQRGTDVHAFAESYAVGEEPERRRDIWHGYTDGIRRWFMEFQPDVLFTERRVVNRRKRLTGRLDLGILLDGRPTICDYKSGGEAPANGIQLAGYVDLADADPELQALAARHGARTWRRAVLNLPGNGDYRWRGQERLDPNDPYYFRSALALLSWRHQHGYLASVDPERPDDDRAGALPAGGGDDPGSGDGAGHSVG